MVKLTQEKMLLLARDSSTVFGAALVVASHYVEFLLANGVTKVEFKDRKKKIELSAEQGLELLTKISVPLSNLAHAVDGYMKNHTDIMTQGHDPADIIAEALKAGNIEPGKEKLN